MDSETTEKAETKKMSPRTRFWVLFTLWTIFACVVPVCFIAWRYQLFQRVGDIQLSGWGMLAIVIIGFFAICVCKYVRTALSIKWSMVGQCVNGTAKVLLPLLALLLLLKSIESSVSLFIQVVGVVTVCEAIAIPLNPFPKYVYDVSKGATQDAIDYFFKRQEESKK